MTHRIEDVLSRGMCVGCGVCGAATSGAIRVGLDTSRVFRADISGASPEMLRRGSSVCPFSDESPNEDSLGAPHPETSMEIDGRLGSYARIFAGRVSDDSYLSDSSSGGIVSWLASELVRRGEVDAVINVGRAGREDQPLYDYGITSDPDDPRRRKSQYFAVTLAEVLEEVRSSDQRFAIVGVPCFIRAVRSLCRLDEAFSQRITIFIGLVCGHFKSQAFAESLAWQLGIHPSELGEVDFRAKRWDQPSNRYDFAARLRGDREWVSRTSSELLGGNWGHVAFQPNACNYCDDVVAETADVSIGDAWLPQFEADPRGTNLVISRNLAVDEIFDSAAKEGTLTAVPLRADDAARAQAGGFRHRRDGLSIRLADDIAAGKSVPKKRVEPAVKGLQRRRARLVRQRVRMAKVSHASFAGALAANDLDVYLSAMRREIAVYRGLESSLARRVLRRLKALRARPRRAPGAGS